MTTSKYPGQRAHAQSLASAPESIYPQLVHMWPHWNVGRLPQYQVHRAQGTVKLIPWEMTTDEANHERLKAAINPKNQGRYVPEGHYVRLSILQEHPDEMTGAMVRDWQTVMSDTPDEMNDHLDPLLRATGRVLVHGLGLGCVLNCLRNIPGVTKIDVVEANPDVMALVKPLHEDDPRIDFHLGSCVDIKWPRGTRWNYVWHDIWSTISADNLTDDAEAEHGISYARLHRMFGRRCDRQASWGFELARNMRWINQTTDRFAKNWTRNFNMSSLDGRVAMWHDIIAPFNLDGAQYAEMTKRLPALNQAEGTLYDEIREHCKEGMTEETAYWLVLDHARAEGLRRTNRRMARQHDQIRSRQSTAAQ